MTCDYCGADNCAVCAAIEQAVAGAAEAEVWVPCGCGCGGRVSATGAWIAPGYSAD